MTAQAPTFKFAPRQILKIVVYTLLLLNFGIYFADDLHFASFTMRNGGSLLEWTSAFATTIDLAAAYWISLGHYHYAWDEVLWIFGFIAIEMNMREWKKEIEHERKQGESSLGAPR